MKCASIDDFVALLWETDVKGAKARSSEELKVMVLKHAPLGEINLPFVTSSANTPRCHRKQRYHTALPSPPILSYFVGGKSQINLVFLSAFTNFARTKKSRVYEVVSIRTLAVEMGSCGGHEAVSFGGWCYRRKTVGNFEFFAFFTIECCPFASVVVAVRDIFL